MRLLIAPSQLTGTLQVPPSKSVFQRLVAASVLSAAPTKIHNPSYSNDGLAALGIADACGKSIESTEDWVLLSGSLVNQPTEVNIGESGLSLRMFTPILSLLESPVNIYGEGSILNRPIGVFDELFKEKLKHYSSNQGKLPIQIQGPLKGGKYVLDGSMSSQHITGMLMALPRCTEDSVLEVSNPASLPYMEMTLEILEDCGVNIETNEELTRFHIPGNQDYLLEECYTDGDWSAAAFLFCAGAIAGYKEFVVEGLDTQYTQADQSIAGVLLFAGSKLKNQLGDYSIVTHKIKGFEYDATHAPDLFPPLAALAVFADRPSKIKGVGRLEFKESNRGLVIQTELKAAGIRVDIVGDEMIIFPGKIKSCIMDSHGDHRIAMMATLIGLGGDVEIEIEGAEAVNKSYPNFYHDLISIGARISEVK